MDARGVGVFVTICVPRVDTLDVVTRREPFVCKGGGAFAQTRITMGTQQGDHGYSTRPFLTFFVYVF